MDDYDLNTLTESKNEWCIRLINLFTPCIISGLRSIFDEALVMCTENDELSKYLMTFQNLLINIPKWGQGTLDIEQERIVKTSNCNYIEDLISCVHIIQLKALTACRVGIKQRKINVQIPNLSSFIHKVYINAARKIYLNIYLFEKDIPPLQMQKNSRELELIIKEVILNTVRENIPVEDLLKAYLDETEETDVIVEEKRETIIDKEQVEENLKKEKEKEKEKDNHDKLLEKSNDDSINDLSTTDKDLLLKMDKTIEESLNTSLEKTKDEIPVNIESDKTNGLELSIKKTPDNVVDDKILTNLNNKQIDNKDITIDEKNVNYDNENSDILKIEDEDLSNGLEIMNIETIDIEPDIKLDIEEL